MAVDICFLMLISHESQNTVDGNTRDQEKTKDLQPQQTAQVECYGFLFSQ